MKKRSGFIIIFFMFLMGIFVFTINVQAKDNVTYTLKDRTLTIQGKGKMPKKMVFKNNKKIKKVVIKNGVTSISSNAFYKCKNLKKVTIGKSVKTIGKKAFAETKITSIKIPNSTTKICRYAFDKCKRLKKITLGKSVKVIDLYAFQNTGITKIKIPNKTEIIGRFAFYNCKNLKTVKLGKSVKNIGSGAFWGTDISSIKIPNKVEIIGAQAFYSCKKLAKVTMGKSVKKIGYLAFASTKITTVEIPNTVKIIGKYAFSSTNKINVKMPGNFKMEKYSGCAIGNAGKIIFTTNLNLKNIQYLEAEYFEVMDSDPNYISVNGSIYTKDKKTLVRIPASSTDIQIVDGCETICVSAFQYNLEYNLKLLLNKTIKNLYIPKTVKNIDDKSYITYEPTQNMILEWKKAVKIKKIELQNSVLKKEVLLKLLDNVTCNKDEILKSLYAES